jgi:hypothetical protein
MSIKPLREGAFDKGGRNDPPTTPRPNGPIGATRPFGRDDAREHLFSAGGQESDTGPRDEAEWYWRRAAKLWRDRAEKAEAAVKSIKKALQNARAE